jgi:16S rRNA (guanine527-N7)-methyltransferase
VHAPIPDSAAISSAFAPYLGDHRLSPDQLEKVRAYLDLLLRWNQRMNLTAVREPSEILSRHFGESFFLANLVGADSSADVIDVGSGAGFPGIPIKIFAPHLQVTLIEANNKKATFLKEVIRAFTLTGINVFSGRAQQYMGHAGLVTMRAVEKFEQALPATARLVRPPGQLALLIGAAQAENARAMLAGFQWKDPVRIPQSRERVALIGVSS